VLQTALVKDTGRGYGHDLDHAFLTLRLKAFLRCGHPRSPFNRYLDPKVYVVSCDNVAGGRMVVDAFVASTWFAFIGGVAPTRRSRTVKKPAS